MFVGCMMSKHLSWNIHDQGFRWLLGQPSSRRRKTKVVIWSPGWTVALLETYFTNACRRLKSSPLGLNYLIWTVWLLLIPFSKVSSFERRSAKSNSFTKQAEKKKKCVFQSQSWGLSNSHPETPDQRSASKPRERTKKGERTLQHSDFLIFLLTPQPMSVREEDATGRFFQNITGLELVEVLTITGC